MYLGGGAILATNCYRNLSFDIKQNVKLLQSAYDGDSAGLRGINIALEKSLDRNNLCRLVRAQLKGFAENLSFDRGTDRQYMSPLSTKNVR